ncbi:MULTISPECIES: spore coat U domain-containing protein [unclassified Halomonas]|uniref:Csu type fimbrial protein n=1 Tax=unclassified Halomonas TaxID=2609666 RepID=UPI00209E3AF1|nr:MULTISPECIES: spore coat U domain-containing protein [unclassified Halomonas]MCP1314372.1 spore coat U domain-containing protein [Halomonas sp. 707D7]MCP1326272.1 spore coat U domain-containing protein [Halomonas sp. 707D4]
MSTRLIKRAHLGAPLYACWFFLPGLVQAQTVTGTIDATMTLVDSCVVNGQTGTTGVDFGDIDFGSTPAVFEEEDSTVAGGGTNGIEVVCSPGVEPTFELTSGLNDGAASEGVHAMSNGAGDFIGYSLYRNDARTDLISAGETVALGAFDGSPQVIELYGRAFGDDGALPAGTYTDTLSVELTF